MGHKRNTDAIVKMAQEKSQKTVERVEQTISKLVVEGKQVNFNIISREADVSKSWLYSKPNIRKRIEDLRGRQISSAKVKKKSTKNRSEASKDAIIVAFKERIKELENENQQLKQQLQVLYGEVYKNN